MRILTAIIACFLSAAALANAKDKILFLHLRINADDTIEVIKSTTRPGKLKTPAAKKGDLKLELKAVDGTVVWTNALEDPRIRVFEVEDPPGSGQLRPQREVTPTAEFTVRVPVADKRANLIVTKRQRTDGKKLLSHPVPSASEAP